MKAGSRAYIMAVSHYGPGGRNCSCCGPAPKHRKAHDRTINRRLRRLARKEIESELA